MKKNKYTVEEKILIFSLLFTTFSGAVRKWGTSNAGISNFILFCQLLIPLFVSYTFSRYNQVRFLNPLFFIYILYLIVEVLNPMNLTIYHGILGFVLYAGFWASLFSYITIRDAISVQKLLPWILIVISVEFVLGIVQYLLPPLNILNRYANEKAGINEIALIGGSVRVAGTFSYISGYSAFVIFIIFIFWIYSLMPKRKEIISNLLPIIAMTAGVVNGSRGVIAVILIIFLCVVVFTKNVISILKNYAYVIVMSLFVYTYVPVVNNFINVASENFISRVSVNAQTGEQNTRILGPVEEVLFFKGNYALTGIGLGATYQGANAIWGESDYAKEYPGGYEEEPERVIIEGGIGLFLLRVCLFIYFIIVSRIPKIPAIIIVLLVVFYIPIIFNIYNGYYLMFSILLLDNAYYNKNKINLATSSHNRI